MNALQTLLAAAERGVLVTVTDEGNLYARLKENLTPELKAALRENKEEIVSGSRPRKERYEILQIMPADNWYVVLGDQSLGYLSECELLPLVGWALVFDHEQGLQWVEGLVHDGLHYETYAWLATEIENHAFYEYVRLQPEEVEEKREELNFDNLRRHSKVAG